MAINKYFSIISQGSAPGNRLVPGGALAIRGSYSQWEQTQESRVVKRAPEAGSDKPRLSLLGDVGKSLTRVRPPKRPSNPAP